MSKDEKSSTNVDIFWKSLEKQRCEEKLERIQVGNFYLSSQVFNILIGADDSPVGLCRRCFVEHN